MSNEALQFSFNFVNTGGCIKCGVPVLLERNFYLERKRDHASFYCPNGHAQCYLQETVEEKLRKELAQKEKHLQNAQKRTEWAEQSARQAKERADKLDRSRAAYKGQLTRVKNGVCPCCRRNKRLRAEVERLRGPKPVQKQVEVVSTKPVLGPGSFVEYLPPGGKEGTIPQHALVLEVKPKGFLKIKVSKHARPDVVLDDVGPTRWRAR